MFLWRAVDDEGEVLDVVVQRRRDTDAVLEPLRRLLRNQPAEPEKIVTDGLASYQAALGRLGLRHLHSPGRLRENNRAEHSHLPIRRRERQQQLLKSRLQLSAFSPPTPRSTTPSTLTTLNDISSAAGTSAFSARGLLRPGRWQPPEIMCG